jgi:hypothetical protein
MEKLNREQRRREKFGHAGGVTKEAWPQSEANPVFAHGGSTDEGEKPAAETKAPAAKPVKPKPSAADAAPKGDDAKV